MATPESNPALLIPRLVSRVWGGSRLRALAAEPVVSGPIGEAWFGDADERPEGVLVKLLDVQDRLSVQVHPNDELAQEVHGAGALGKHEAWVILEAAPGAEILLGRDPRVSAEEVTRALATGGDVTPLLARHKVQRGDVFNVPTGCLHAMMPGLFIWEVQQRSDRTYRVADWGRNDPTRPLHRAEALRATDADHRATRTSFIRWGRPGEQLLLESPHFSARAVVGPWTGAIVVGAHGATATVIGGGRVEGQSLGDLETVHLAAGLQSVDLAAGAVLLIAEGN